MGSSFTEYRGNGFWTRDALLEIWLHRLVLAIDGRPVRLAWLQDARDHWQLHATVGYTGCVSASLDEWLGGDPDRVTTVADLSAEALRGLRDARSIRHEDLTAAGIGGQRTQWRKDMPAHNILPVAEAFIDLIAGRIDWDASTSPVL